MIIKTNLLSPDILINTSSKIEFNLRLQNLLTEASTPGSLYYIEEDLFYRRLIDCTLRLAPMVINDESCPLIFDSWSCYNSTPAGEFMYEPCPDKPELNFDTDKMSSKYCTENGSWWVHPLSNRTWSNYTGCLDIQDFTFRNNINRLNDIGLIVSLVSLLMSITIFAYAESLRCGRISVHKNLFMSLTLNNFGWIIWGHTILSQPDIWSFNPIWCTAFNIVLTYFTVTTYFWMMCEGAYLHMILFNSLENDSLRLKLLKVLGWGVPCLVVVPYATYRYNFQNSDCWVDMGESSWFVGVPVVMIMLVNIAMLINVIVVLRSKLREESSNLRRNSWIVTNIKQLKAVCFLVPVLGLHFILVPIRPSPDSHLERAYDLLLTISSSFQGKQIF